MTPDSPSSADGSALPPRHRPNMGTHAKDTTEQDLWDFDDIDVPEEAPVAALPKPPATQPLPSPRDPEKMAVRQINELGAARRGGERDRIQVDISLNRPKPPAGPLTSQAQSGHAQPGNDFDDLDQWEESAPAKPVQGMASVPSMPVVAEKTPPAPETAPAVAAKAEEVDEFSPVRPADSVPVSLRPHLHLSKLERAGLLALVALLSICGVLIFLNTISRLPSGSTSAKAVQFPVQGKHLSILSADSHWRAPKESDTVRRGTQLVPVLNLTTVGGPAAIRVFFRNNEGEVIGDAVTRYLQAPGKIQVAATAGFDDVGMHAAYRTGQSKPWTIEVLEAPSGNSPGTEFKKLFQIDVSADRR